MALSGKNKETINYLYPQQKYNIFTEASANWVWRNVHKAVLNTAIYEYLNINI